MATKTSQRLFIIVLAVVMLVGTIGSFAVLVLAGQNEEQDAARRQEEIAKWQKEYEAHQKKVDAQGEKLSKKYYPIFKQYAKLPAKFEHESVKKLNTKDLKKGDGAEIKDDTKFAVYYIGWNPDGKVFDQSIKDDKLASPLPVAGGLVQAGLIEGWKKGLIGMKIGGVRLLEIPSDLAYGEAGSGDDIPPNAPLKFVVMAIPLPEQFAEPEMPNMMGMPGGF